MNKQTRRNILRKSGTVLATGVAAAATTSAASASHVLGVGERVVVDPDATGHAAMFEECDVTSEYLGKVGSCEAGIVETTEQTCEGTDLVEINWDDYWHPDGWTYAESLERERFSNC